MAEVAEFVDVAPGAAEALETRESKNVFFGWRNTLSCLTGTLDVRCCAPAVLRAAVSDCAAVF